MVPRNVYSHRKTHGLFALGHKTPAFWFKKKKKSFIGFIQVLLLRFNRKPNMKFLANPIPRSFHPSPTSPWVSECMSHNSRIQTHPNPKHYIILNMLCLWIRAFGKFSALIQLLSMIRFLFYFLILRNIQIVKSFL